MPESRSSFLHKLPTNGSECIAEVIRELKDIWPVRHIVHGKPRHLQCQRSIERASVNIKDMVATLLSYNSTQDCPALGLRSVQNQKNSAYQAGIKCTPYSAIFGCGPKLGLKSKSLLQEIIEQLETSKISCLLSKHPQTPLLPTHLIVISTR